MNNNIESKFELKVKAIIADAIGVETLDINNADRFTEELHMGLAELTDLIEKISGTGINTKNIEVSELTTVESLIEELESEEII